MKAKIDKKTQEIGSIEHTILVNKRLHKHEVDKVASDLSRVTSQRDHEAKRYQRLQLTMNARRENNFVTIRLRHILNTWRRTCKERIKCVKVIQKCMFKLYSQTALDRIRNDSHLKKKTTDRENKAKLFTSLQRRLELREFFKRWRSFTRTLELTIKGKMRSKESGGA